MLLYISHIRNLDQPITTSKSNFRRIASTNKIHSIVACIFFFFFARLVDANKEQV